MRKGQVFFMAPLLTTDICTAVAGRLLGLYLLSLHDHLLNNNPHALPLEIYLLQLTPFTQ